MSPRTVGPLRFKTTVAGGFVIESPSTHLFDHVTRALHSARRGERAYIRSNDSPFYVLEFRRVEDRIEIRTTCGSRLIAPTMPDYPRWFDQAIEISTRLTEEQSCPTP
jgi:hypothetical protein